MEIIKQWSGVVALVILAITLLSSSAPKFAGVTNYDELDATAIKVGSSGSRVGPIISSTCALIAPNFTVAASTTAPMDCAVTGIVSGDIVFGQFGTSTATSFQGGWEIVGASASSTSGFITFRVYNGTGGSNLLPAALASSTQYLVLHPLSSVPGL